MIYEKKTNDLGTEIVIGTDTDGKLYFIPIDVDNSDYQRYLESLEKKK